MSKIIDSMVIYFMGILTGVLLVGIFWPEPDGNTQGSRFDQPGNITIKYWQDGKVIGSVDSCEKAILRNFKYCDSITISPTN